MGNIKNKLRNFRVTEALDNDLVEAAERVKVDVSKLLRCLIIDGTKRVMNDKSYTNSLRKRYAI